MPFRPTFDCLWCGAHHSVADRDDLAGWAQLCPDCIGRAGENTFIRYRVRSALEARGQAGATDAGATDAGVVGAAADVAGDVADGTVGGHVGAPAAAGGLDPEMVAYYEARAGEYDDWYLRRGRYAHGPIEDTAWAADLDRATLWLDGLPWHGEIVELAAGTGWWSPLLASRGRLSCYDAAAAPLGRARERLLAHGLRAHLHVRDAWAEPDRTVDGLFAGFWLSHVERATLPAFLALARRWLRPGGFFAFVDSRPDPSSGVTDRLPEPTPERSRRRLADGREFTIPKVFYQPAELEAALHDAGFEDVAVETSARFFLLGRAAV